MHLNWNFVERQKMAYQNERKECDGLRNSFDKEPKGRFVDLCKKAFKETFSSGEDNSNMVH